MQYTTNVTLLEKVIAGDELSWEAFRNNYAPLIRCCGEEWKLTPVECDELVQDVMINFFKASASFHYDRQKGHFRSYLRTIARNSVFALLRKRRSSTAERDDAAPLLDYAFDEKWDIEWYNYLCSEALGLLKKEMEPISYESFYKYVIEGMPPAEVASRLGITVNAVYINKSRAVERLRKTVKKLEEL